MFNLGMRSMLGWFDSIASWITGWANALFTALLGYILLEIYALYAGVGFLCDILESVFRQLAGLGEPIDWGIGRSTSGDILTDFLRNSQIQRIFVNLMLVAVVLIIVFTVFAILKSEYTQSKDTTKTVIVGRGLKALFMFFLVPSLTFGGIYISNQLLKTLDKATRNSGAITLSANVFMCASYNANKANYEVDANGKIHYVDEEFYNQLNAETPNKYNLGYFGQSRFHVSDNDSEELKKESVSYSISEQINYAVTHGIPDGAFNGVTYDLKFDLMENPVTYFCTLWPLQEWEFNCYNPRVIGTYYNIFDINYIILFGGIFVIFLLMCQIILGLIVRIFNIAMLYVTAPPILAMMPLDNGGAFGKWKNSMMGHVVGAYGAVVGMNLALIFMSVSSNLNFSITLFGKHGYNSVIVTMFMRLLFIIVALNFAKKMPNILSGFIGAQDVFESGKGFTSDVLNTAKKGAGIAAGGAGIAFRQMRKMNKVNSAVVNSPASLVNRIRHGKADHNDAEGNIIRRNKEGKEHTQKLFGNTKVGKVTRFLAGGGLIKLTKNTGGALKSFGSTIGNKTGLSNLASDIFTLSGVKDTPAFKAFSEGKKKVKSNFFNYSGVGRAKNVEVGNKLIDKENEAANKIINEYNKLKDKFETDGEVNTTKKNEQDKLSSLEADQELLLAQLKSPKANKGEIKQQIIDKKEEIKEQSKRVSEFDKFEKFNKAGTEEYASLDKANKTIAQNEAKRNALNETGGNLSRLPEYFKEFGEQIGKEVAKAMAEEKIKAKFGEEKQTVNAKGEFEGKNETQTVENQQVETQENNNKDLFTEETKLGSYLKDLIREGINSSSGGLINEEQLKKVFERAKIKTDIGKEQFAKFTKIFNEQLAALRTMSKVNGKVGDDEIVKALKEFLKEVKTNLKK